MLPVMAVVFENEPGAKAYWTDHPAKLMVAVVGLNNSMKSFFQVAPVLPPPPYTWLMTRLVPPGLEGAASPPVAEEGAADWLRESPAVVSVSLPADTQLAPPPMVSNASVANIIQRRIR